MQRCTCVQVEKGAKVLGQLRKYRIDCYPDSRGPLFSRNRRASRDGLLRIQTISNLVSCKGELWDRRSSTCSLAGVHISHTRGRYLDFMDNINAPSFVHAEIYRVSGIYGLPALEVTALLCLLVNPSPSQLALKSGLISKAEPPPRNHGQNIH